MYVNGECSLTVGLLCDSTLGETDYTTKILEMVGMPGELDCKYRTELTSKAACPVYSTNEFWTWLNEYYYLWGTALILIGFPVSMWGH